MSAKKKHQPTADSEWPEDQTKVRALMTKGPDDLGRYSFDLLWWQDGLRRAQCFHGIFRPTARDALYTWDEIKVARRERVTW